MKRAVGRDTFFLSGIQLGTQALGLMLNVFLTRRLGSEAVGMVALISSFFWLCSVFASGNGFVAASRFVAEEIGRGTGNPRRMLLHCASLSMLMSVIVSTLICVAAPLFAERALHDPTAKTAIYLLAATLPFSSVTACLKGYFHAYRQVLRPAFADTLEFLVRGAMMAFSVGFLIPQGRCGVMTALSWSMLIGQLCAFLILLVSFLSAERSSGTCTIRFPQYLFAAAPVMINSYVTSVLSTANDALIPLTLQQFGHTSADALSQFGLFDAILLPALFFPSVILSCLSCILVPELSRERAAGNTGKVCGLIRKGIRTTLVFSTFVMLFVFLCGDTIGTLVGGTPFAGRMLRCLAPVVPFIYLEIVLEAILRGMGKQNLSSLNYIAEYVIRISVLLICVPLFGFYGLLASYYASNVVGNCVRLAAVARLCRSHITWKPLLVPPVLSALLTWQLSALLLHLPFLQGLSPILQLIGFVLFGGLLYIFLVHYTEALCTPSQSTVKKEKIPTAV